AGFAWQKSLQVADKREWMTLVRNQAQIVASPLEVTVK
ncbi:MAG: hypothetical protein V4581_00360, partial [Bacteroidota bacterium]